MIKAILFDLDDTLLGNDMEKFLPAYFMLLGKHAERYLDRERFLHELMFCTQAMIGSRDTAVSNRDVFWQTFQQRTGLDPDELEPFFDRFYCQTFPQLRTTTEKRDVAAPLVQNCFAQGLKVVVATNPLFPARAIKERLDWAGTPVTMFDYALVTTYENMHAAKPNPAYYAEILRVIDCAPESALMVGDDWKNDIVPAAELGLFTYWISRDGQEPPEKGLATDHGSLAALRERVQSGWLGELA
ncbi:MAG: HAD family hydrolase [Chloroflexi bacterium]|nr:HAD family hydrolase [Chloroflexota bacterium]